MLNLVFLNGEALLEVNSDMRCIWPPIGALCSHEQSPLMTCACGLPQGARIGRNVYIDSLDFSDFDLINIGDDVAINEGATLLGHYFKDGLLHFGEV